MAAQGGVNALPFIHMRYFPRQGLKQRELLCGTA